MLISVVLPCYNPPQNWAVNILAEREALLGMISDEMEFVLVVDGFNPSLDNEIELLRKSIPFFKCVKYEVNRGKGYALRKGVAEAEGDIIIYTDIDFPYSTKSFFDIYSSLKMRDCDLAVGIKNEAYYKYVSLSRKILSKGLRWLIKFFLSVPITDTQCGLKGFVKKIKPVFLKTSIDRYLFDLEFIRTSARLNYTLKPVPLQLNEDVQFRVMNYRLLFPEMINFLKLVFKRR